MKPVLDLIQLSRFAARCLSGRKVGYSCFSNQVCNFSDHAPFYFITKLFIIRILPTYIFKEHKSEVNNK